MLLRKGRHAAGTSYFPCRFVVSRCFAHTLKSNSPMMATSGVIRYATTIDSEQRKDLHKHKQQPEIHDRVLEYNRVLTNLGTDLPENHDSTHAADSLVVGYSS